MFFNYWIREKIRRRNRRQKWLMQREVERRMQPFDDLTWVIKYQHAGLEGLCKCDLDAGLKAIEEYRPDGEPPVIFSMDCPTHKVDLEMRERRAAKR